MPDEAHPGAALEAAEEAVRACDYGQIASEQLSEVLVRLGRVAVALQHAYEALAVSTAAWRETVDQHDDLAVALHRLPEDLASAARAAAGAATRASARSFDGFVDPVEVTTTIEGRAVTVRARMDVPYVFGVREAGADREQERPCTWDGLVPALVEVAGAPAPSPRAADDLAHEINNALNDVQRAQASRWPAPAGTGTGAITDGLLDVHRDGARLAPALAEALIAADAQTDDPPGLLSHDDKDWEEPLPRADVAFADQVRALLQQARKVVGPSRRAGMRRA